MEAMHALAEEREAQLRTVSHGLEEATATLGRLAQSASAPTPLLHIS